MNTELTRRAFFGALVGGAVAGVGAFAGDIGVEQFAPFSGSAWRATERDVSGAVDSPYGPATVRYDGHHVPHVDADDGRALYYAVGYVHGKDRLFQVDVQRRLMRGTVSAAVGDAAVESDRFHRRMDFARAAEATWDAVRDTPSGPLVEAYSEGLTACIEDHPLPVEFQLLDYEPDPWRPADTVLLEKQIAWTLTGSFRTLRRALLRRELGEAAVAELYPARYDHESPILPNEAVETTGTDAARATVGPDTDATSADALRDVDTDLADWLGPFESGPGIGSNSWVVSGEYTDSGAPIVANDPHLSLMAPPVWYEQHLESDGLSVRGVTFPGVPFVVIGENHAGAWGFTNAGADVIDFYTYDEPEAGRTYRYRGETREFDRRTETIAVRNGPDREVTVTTSVHGPVVEREGQRVAVAWTGLGATRTTEAIRRMNAADGLDDFRAATPLFDEPTQNLVYADRDGNTYYYVTGQIPYRYTDGERVRGDRVFDGSAGEGEWRGFEPYGRPDWDGDGFVDFADKPGAVNPGYVGTANQRIVDDPGFYLSEGYAPPFRGRRLYDRLESGLEEGTVDPEWNRDLQRDTYDGRAAMLAPVAVEAADRLDRGADDDETGGTDGQAAENARTMADWDYRMDRDSRAALVFSYWIDAFREATWEPTFEAAGLDSSYYPSDWILATLPAGSRWFDGDRAAVAVEALRTATRRLDSEADHDTFGDYNRTDLTHPFDQSFLAYPDYPTDGSPGSLRNYHVEDDSGSSWRMVCPMDGDSRAVLPGGNSGDPFSDHYADQLRAWADGEYKPLVRESAGEVVLRFGGEQ